MTTHPGSITYVDADANSEQTMPIAKVPESLRFVKNEQGVEVPVVRVVSKIAGKQRFIKEYGPANEFLRETIQLGA
jgi:hypothetical protein